ncbi:hypothetical protein MKW98_003191 [Papaver atlanticum]|uniref:Uncharacterized protein n=1 Tax=Papaver atlanticum TaxID=357466 RepID=A0AAD4TIB7_9MAGN|nr:hypothetical protein MKW98_003191 [Papaver atlanticum]
MHVSIFGWCYIEVTNVLFLAWIVFMDLKPDQTTQKAVKLGQGLGFSSVSCYNLIFGLLLLYTLIRMSCEKKIQ